MKKYLLAFLIGSLLVLALVTTAMADNGPHGSFTATTDACAGCHRVHSAQYGSNSLLKTDPESLCLGCHDGSGAATNVEDGVYVVPLHSGWGSSEGTIGASLFGGGFENALMATAWSGATTANPAFNAVSRPTTSHHNIGTAGTIWGSGAVNTANGSMTLECTACHDPHGGAGWNVYNAQIPNLPSTTTVAKVPSYRLLRWQPQGSGGFTPPTSSVNWSGGAFPSNGQSGNSAQTGWLVPDKFSGPEWYTIGTTGAFALGDYNAGNADNVYKPTNFDYVPAAVNTAFFCAQCHDRYFNNSRLRNATDVSMFCGHPLNGTTPPYTGSPLFLPYLPDADGVAPWIHPVDSARCEPVVSTTTGLITGWGDNGDGGDQTYKYRHSSGDIRLSMDGATSIGSGTSVSRSCVACHVAHGTAAQMTAFAASETLAANSSILLRMDNRSVCLRCHASNVNFVVAP
jgi:predicted CXXCH cytochrome family protein